MMLYNLYRRFCQAMAAVAFAEAGEHETARLLQGKDTRPVPRKGGALGKAVPAN